MKRDDLLVLISDDDLGLLTIKPNKTSQVTTDERLIASFLEINNFFQNSKREPELGSGLQEHQLASRLKSIREDKSKITKLLDYDEYNLLSVEIKKISTIKDIFSDDEFKILDNSDDTLFQLENLSKQTERSSADYISRRKPCKDFDKYKNVFIDSQNKLKSGIYKLKKLEKHNELKEKSLFVLGGVLGLIVKTYKLTINNQKKLNGRLRIIFENGTESNMLLQSLIKSLQDYNGWLVFESSSIRSSEVNQNDTHTGFIYILKSLSDDPKIRSIKNLYKIGYSTIPVEERIKNASTEPAYLMAPVKIITTFECFNFNPQKLEQLLHNFFGSSCLNVDVFGNNNNRYIPREWFIAPLIIIEETIELIINGGIVSYKYNSAEQVIVLR